MASCCPLLGSEDPKAAPLPRMLMRRPPDGDWPVSAPKMLDILFQFDQAALVRRPLGAPPKLLLRGLSRVKSLLVA